MRRCDGCVAQLRQSDPKAADDFLAASAARSMMDDGHEDRSSVKPLPVPVVLIGNKLDAMKDVSARRRYNISGPAANCCCDALLAAEYQRLVRLPLYCLF